MLRFLVASARAAAVPWHMFWEHPTAYVALLWTGDTCFLRFKRIYFFNIPSPSGFELLTGAEVVSCVNPRVGDTWDLLGLYVCFR